MNCPYRVLAIICISPGFVKIRGIQIADFVKVVSDLTFQCFYPAKTSLIAGKNISNLIF